MAVPPRGAQKSFSNPFDRLTTRSLTWGAIVAAAVLAVNVPLTYRNTRQIEENAAWLAHSHEVVNELASLLILVKDAETGVRGFMITGDAQDTVPIAEVRKAIGQRVSALDTLLVDNTQQAERLARIDEVALLRMEALEQLQTIARVHGRDSARQVMIGARTNRIGDSLRRLVDEMTESEQHLLATRAGQAGRTYQQAARSGVFAGLAALVAFMGFVIVLRRELAARAQAASLLAEERERLDTTLRSIGDAVITTDPGGRISAMNAIAEQLTGLPSMVAVGKPLEEVYRIPFDPSVSHEEHPVRAVLAGRRSRSELHSLTLRSHDGTARPIDQTAAAIVTASGQRLGGVLVFRDVSEQQAAQQRIRAGQQRLQLALRSARLVSFDIAFDGGLLTLSENVADVLALAPGHTLRTLDDALAIVHADDLPEVIAALKSVEQPGDSFQVSCRIHREARGDIGWVEVRGEVQLTRDGKRLITGLVLDVTERVAAERSLRESEARFRSMADSAPVMIWMTASDGRFTYLNQRWYEFTGDSADDATALEAPFARIHPDDRMEQLRQFVEALDTHRTFRQEMRLRRHDGAYRWVINSATPRFGEHGEWRGFIGSIIDIEDRKLLENELRMLAADLSQADQRKDEFLATLAHELRNPLAPLRNGVEILRLATPTPEVLERTRGMMERQLGQLVRLVDDLLDVSRITSGKLELRHDLLTLQVKLTNASEASNPLLASRAQRLHISAPDEPVIVEGDAARLSQIFANLLDNASKYSPRDSDIHATITTTDTTAIVTIRDEGQGIPPHLLHKVFDLFAQVDRTLERTTGGLGIGLTLVKRLVEMHGGTITAESAGEGQGSTFTVTLPLAHAAAGSPHRRTQGAIRPQGEGLSIIICDDNVDASLTLETILRAGGHQVETVHDGLKALERAGTQPPAVMIIDLGMPGLNGFETAERIRQLPNGDRIVLIALTGWGNDDYRQRARAAGFDHHLVKPADPTVLGDLLARISRQRRASEHTAR